MFVEALRKQGGDELLQSLEADQALRDRVVVSVIAAARPAAETPILGSFRILEDLGITFPALARPTPAELKQYGVARIESDTSPIEAGALRFGTVLTTTEERIGGDEYERRRLVLDGQMYGFQQALWLIENQRRFPKFMGLLGKVYVDFLGLIVVSEHGDRYFPCVNNDGKRWNLNWNHVDNNLNRNGRIASNYK